MADALAGRTGFPGLDVIAEVLRVPELRNAFASRVIEPRIRVVLDMLQRAAERREIDATRVDALVARTGPALVIETFLLTGAPPAAEELARIVDRVMIPLIVPSRPSAGR
jgi:cell division ATPase FtsA